MVSSYWNEKTVSEMYVTSTNEMIYEDIVAVIKSEMRYAKGLVNGCDISLNEVHLNSSITEFVVTFKRFGCRNSFVIKVDRKEKIYCKDVIYKIRKNFKLCLCDIINSSYMNENIIESGD